MNKLTDEQRELVRELYASERRAMTARAEVDLRCRSDAADVVGDAFVRLVRSLSRGDTIHNPRAWTWRALRNRIIDIVRRRERRYQYCGEVLYLEDDMPATDERQDLTVIVDRAHDIYQGLDALPSRQALAVGLFYFEQCDLQQTGDRLDIKPSAAKALLYRARENLRAEMEDSYAEA